VSIYNAIPLRYNIIKLATACVAARIFALTDFPNVIQPSPNLNYTSSVVALLEELDQAYIWMVDKSMWYIASL